MPMQKWIILRRLDRPPITSIRLRQADIIRIRRHERCQGGHPVWMRSLPIRSSTKKRFR
jgi:hypothetical protein